MRFSSAILLAVAALVPSIMATELKLNNGDVPAACVATCRLIVQLGDTCYKNGENGATQCICNNKTFDTAGASLQCQQCFVQQNVGAGNGREHINKVVSTCNFKTMLPSAIVNNSFIPITTPSPLKPVTVYVTVNNGGGLCTNMNKTTTIYTTSTPVITTLRPATTIPFTSIRPTTTLRPSTTVPAANATRPNGAIPTAGASSVGGPGVQLAAVAAFIYMLA